MNRKSWAVMAALTAVGATASAADNPGAVAPVTRTMAVAPDILGTRAIPIRAERFVINLARAREDDSTNPRLQRMIAPARSLSRAQQLAFVQKAVHRQVEWMSDATLWGQHDYWASASETLARGAGDMEDRAILKMQALIALGFDRRDLFLTLARDSVDGPIMVLTARIGGRYFILDDGDGAPFDSEQRHYELQPAMSFGMSGAWLHTNAGAPKMLTSMIGK
jgi:predicted transglutaminase-like cysteine proteinase